VALPSSVRTALTVAGLVVAAAGLHAVSPTTSDPDGFYHIRHAWVYRTQGLFDSGFPWARFSAIRDQASDLWYGFHLLLVPFSVSRNLLDGLLAGGVSVTAAALVVVWASYRRLGLAFPLAWVLAFAATGDVLFRLTMLRPQPLSLALALLALGLLAAEDVRRRAVLLGLVAFAAAFLHLALAWLVPLVAGAFLVATILERRPARWTDVAGACLGAIAGAALRPNPIGALRLAWIQIGLFMDVKRRALPLPFGAELQPLVWRVDGGVLLLIPLVGLLALLAVFAVRRWKGEPAPLPSTAAWTSLGLFLLFALLSVRVASRSVELAAAFGAAFAGLAWTELWRNGSARARRIAVAGLAVFLLALVPLGFSRYLARVNGARPLLAYRGAGLWLDSYARPGQVVFHAWWDQFAHLFFWSPRTFYLGGMDPLFQYAHDETLFWKAHGLAGDEHPERMCGQPACGPGMGEETPLVLRRDFGATFVLVQRSLNPRLDGYLAASPAFLRVFDDGTDVLYALQYDGLPPSGGSP
jgi:hypothetical protein